ncbi:hypothetical protein PO878_19740 [Iamia majanohamensis]|uniref:Uncharacterized protein n=1 Tax=Iamia majanohamensis TaxID=467976 RepID=A0AAF0BTF6_9ACTN|nr:hypothetical protein [Iamia majanohamensis]WCO66727.1 hypothetical protein PO878_19740 [Iamia majanohamensis]
MRIHVARGGHVDAEQLLGGHGEHQLVEERGGVVHAGDVGRALEVGELLARLLHARVEVPDDRLGAQDPLAVELEHQAQHPVGGGVLRPHVHDRGGGLVGVGLDVAHGGHVGLGVAQDAAALAQHLDAAGHGAHRHLLGALVGEGAVGGGVGLGLGGGHRRVTSVPGRP